MDKLTKYIYNHHFNALFSYFLPLFFIASLIFFVKIASLTSIIQLTFFELFILYIFIFPQIIFFTLPIVYFVGGVASLYRLSYDYEAIALFSLGIHPNNLIKLFFKTATLLCIILLAYSIVLIPQAKQLYKGFIIKKRAEAKLNIKPSEFGHKFGNWFLYIEKKDKKGNFVNASLYNKDQSIENLIIAQKANIINTSQGLQLLLFNGKAFTYKGENLKKISFNQMQIFDTSSSFLFSYKSPFDYWSYTISHKKGAFDITLFILFSFFPLVSLYLIVSLGVKNPRFDKTNIFFSSLFAITLYFSLSFLLAKIFTFFAILIIPLWSFFGYIYYKKTILSRY